MLTGLFVLFVVLLKSDSYIYASASGDCIPERCPNFGTTTHYREMGCSPVYSSTDNCCPIKYNCADFPQRLSATDKCFYNGKTYSRDEMINYETLKERCESVCFCRGGPRGFSCAIIECGRYFSPPPVDPCYYKYRNSEVCCDSIYCPKQNETVPTCNVNDQLYRAGEYVTRQEPEFQCKRCLCEANADNTTATLNCDIKVHCGIELKYGYKLARTCAPIYRSGNKCCPMDYKCPTDMPSEDSVKKINEDGMKCLFGQQYLNLGEKLSPEQCLSCTCMTPPLLTCINKCR